MHRIFSIGCGLYGSLELVTVLRHLRSCRDIIIIIIITTANINIQQLTVRNSQNCSSHTLTTKEKPEVILAKATGFSFV